MFGKKPAPEQPIEAPAVVASAIRDMSAPEFVTFTVAAGFIEHGMFNQRDIDTVCSAYVDPERAQQLRAVWEGQLRRQAAAWEELNTSLDDPDKV